MIVAVLANAWSFGSIESKQFTDSEARRLVYDAIGLADGPWGIPRSLGAKDLIVRVTAGGAYTKVELIGNEEPNAADLAKILELWNQRSVRDDENVYDASPSALTYAETEFGQGRLFRLSATNQVNISDLLRLIRAGKFDPHVVYQAPNYVRSLNSAFVRDEKGVALYAAAGPEFVAAGQVRILPLLILAVALVLPWIGGGFALMAAFKIRSGKDISKGEQKLADVWIPALVLFGAALMVYLAWWGFFDSVLDLWFGSTSTEPIAFLGLGALFLLSACGLLRFGTKNVGAPADKLLENYTRPKMLVLYYAATMAILFTCWVVIVPAFGGSCIIFFTAVNTIVLSRFSLWFYRLKLPDGNPQELAEDTGAKAESLRNRYGELGRALGGYPPDLVFTKSGPYAPRRLPGFIEVNLYGLEKFDLDEAEFLLASSLCYAPVSMLFNSVGIAVVFVGLLVLMLESPLGFLPLWFRDLNGRIVLFLILSFGFGFGLIAIFKANQRRADRRALRLTGNREAAMRALRKLVDLREIEYKARLKWIEKLRIPD